MWATTPAFVLARAFADGAGAAARVRLQEPARAVWPSMSWLLSIPRGRPVMVRLLVVVTRPAASSTAVTASGAGLGSAQVLGVPRSSERPACRRNHWALGRPLLRSRSLCRGLP